MISVAWAQDAATANSTMAMVFSYLPLVFVFAIFYLLIIRPQNQAAKAHAALLNSLTKGTMVQTQGGLIGSIVSLDDQELQLRIADDVVVRVARLSVARVIEAPVAGSKPVGDKAAKRTK